MLTIVMAVYGQPLMLARQISAFIDYGVDVCEKLHVRIVDDHGTPPVNIDTMQYVPGTLDLRVYRVSEDIPWNQMGARNIGMREAPAGPCVMLDPDMIIEPSMIGSFLAAAEKLPRGQVIKFGLKHVSGRKKIDMSSPNTWLIHKEDFFAVGGYDEDFRGHKGWSDCMLQETIKAFYPIHQRSDLYVKFFLPSDGPKDAQVMTSAGVDRDVGFNRTLKLRKNEAVTKWGGHKRYIARGLKGKNFRSPWKRVI